MLLTMVVLVAGMFALTASCAEPALLEAQLVAAPPLGRNSRGARGEPCRSPF